MDEFDSLASDHDKKKKTDEGGMEENDKSQQQPSPLSQSDNQPSHLDPQTGLAQGRDGKKQDGGKAHKTKRVFICENMSLLLIFYFTTIVLTGSGLVVNQYIDNENVTDTKETGKPTRKPTGKGFVNIFGTEIFLMIMMFIAVVSIICFWIWTWLKSKRQLKSVDSEESDPDSQHTEEHSITYLLGSVYVFVTGTFLLIVFEITDYFHCGINLPNDRKWEKKHYPTHFVFYLTLLMFTTVQVFFLGRFFSSPKLHRSSWSVLLLVHLLAANVIWALFTVAEETGIFLGVDAKEVKGLENFQCSHNGTEDYVHKVLEQAKPYLEPFVIEYALIVAGLLFSMIRHAAKVIKKKSISDHEGTPFTEDIEKPEKRSRYPTPASELTSDTHDDRMNIKEIIRTQRSALFLFIAGIILALFMIVSTWSLKDRMDYENTLLATYAIQMFAFLMEAISSVYILAMLPVQSRRPRTLKTDDRLLLISVSLGIIALDVFTIIAGLGVITKKSVVISGESISIDPHNPAILLVFFCLLNVASALVETYTIIEAQRFKRTKSPRPTFGYRLSLPDAPTGPVLFLLAINLGHWIKDAFFELKNDGSKTFPFGESFYSEFAWQVITRGIYPLCIFFRFHAAAMLFDVWRKFLPKDIVWVMDDHNPSSQDQNGFIHKNPLPDDPGRSAPSYDTIPKDAASWDPTKT